ncbi:MAG: alpha/beta hydrolase [Solirubrobacterales bacterium]|nr:alpha/beta hydrolase [Solirubrobacterales bacterium]
MLRLGDDLGATRKRFSRDGTDLSVLDWGGSGRSVVLLHGLAGHAGEWVDTVRHRTEGARVVAFDARGHGCSTRSPIDVSMEALADDVTFLIGRLELEEVILVGQSLGGQVALSVAAGSHVLVSGLVMVEAGPDRGGGDTVEEAIGYLAGWPVPFESREAAEEYFGGPSLRACRWADGLEERSDGLWPRFEIEVMRRMLTEAAETEHWDEWESLRVPALVVTAEDGSVPAEERARMRATGGAAFVEIPGAGHDVHLDAVTDFSRSLRDFLERVSR